MNIIVIPDIHTKYEKAARIIERYNHTHKFVFVGDYFDQFNDNPEINQMTAEWLKYHLNDDNKVFLVGNHDIHYMPWASFFCSGFSTAKKEAINSVLSIDDWNKLKYFHFENGWFFSHGGLSEHWFKHPVNDNITPDHVQRVVDSSIEELKMSKLNNAIYAADIFRGGRNKKGGLLWNDWRNMDLIVGIKQVVGHTPLPRVTAISDNITNSSIVNVDCSSSGIYMSEVLEISEGGNTKILDTSYV
jgi:hypothetical protein